MEKYKFIMYLDLDGVLTSSDYIKYIHKRFINSRHKEFEYRNFMHKYCFQREAVECLNKLYDLLPYCIIITSTRRFEFTPTEWDFIFKLNGIKPYVGGRTLSFSKNKNRFTWREDEIEQYHYNKGSMFNFEKIPFIVIDDDIKDLMKLQDKLIKVKTKGGLTLEYYNEIINKLKLQGVEINGYKESKSI